MEYVSLRCHACPATLTFAFQGNFMGCLYFMEATHIVEILREAGHEGLSVKDIASKVTELRRAKDPKSPEIDPSKTSTLSRGFRCSVTSSAGL